MGVEYKHFLVPENPSFIPAKEVLKKIDDVLTKWNLKKGTPVIHNLTQGENTIVLGPLEDIDPGHGISLDYPSVDGIAAAKIMGKSYYNDEAPDENRYIQGMVLIAGLDYRIHPNSEELTVMIEENPSENDELLEAYCEYDDLHFGLHGEAYHCSLMTTAPKVDVWSVDKKRILGEQNFKGYWRTAFCIDCGKDLPALGDELYTIPNREFIYDFEKALGTTIIEVGEVY